MVSTMKIVDTKSGPAGTPFRVRVNRTGRRTYSPEYKLEIVEECRAPGVSVAAVGLTHRINANLVRRWIVQHRAGRLIRTPMMLPVTLSPSSPPRTHDAVSAGSKHATTVGVIEIKLEGARIRVRGAVDGAALRTVIELLVKR
jgi:transposase